MRHITVYINGVENDYTTLTFPGGERHVRLAFAPSHIEDTIRVVAHLENTQDVLDLLFLTDALNRRRGRITTRENRLLILPYIPYARQDRVAEPGESLTLRVFCELINNLKYDCVEVFDAHSDVSLALLNNVKNYPPQTFVQMIPLAKATTVLVAPDAGASKKVYEVAKKLGYSGVVQGTKHRDTATGKITDTTVDSGHVGDKDFLIVDDICDGGRTFIELAKVLRPLTKGKIYLYVTHGIFSKGLGALDGFIDHIYVANTFESVDLTHPLISKLG